MQIISKEVEIAKPLKLTSEYVDTELQKLGFDVLHWAILDAEGDILLLNAACVVVS